MTREHILELDELHTEACIRLIRAIALHRIVPAHTREGRLDIEIEQLLEEIAGHPLEDRQHILLLDEAHLTVDLSELRLAVRTKILVTEALDDLEIAIKATNHQQLLEGLRRLGQSVELVRVHTGGHDEVTSTLWRRLNEDRRLYFEEALTIKIAAHGESEAVTQLKVGAYAATTQVKVAVLHTQVVPTIGIIFDSEGRHLCRIEYAQRLDRDLDIPRRELRILILTLSDLTRDLDDVLTTELLSLRDESLAYVSLIEDELSDTIAVTKVDEGHPAHTACLLDPASERHLLPDITEAQGATGSSAIHIFFFLDR